MLLIAGLAAALLGLQTATPQEVPVLKANLGDCSADFVVRDADAKPVYNATIHVRVRYGFMSLKRSDLEVGTNADGRARIEGLPSKAKPLTYDVRKGDAKGEATQNVGEMCHAAFDLSIK
jgi:hypothetical protein